MDFSPDDLDVSPPCFLVENSQADESQQLGRSDGDQHLAILKQLPIFRVAATRGDTSAGNATNDQSVPQNPVAVTCPATGGKEEGDPGRVQGNGGEQPGGGSDGSGGGDDGGGDGGGGDAGGEGGGGGGGEAGGGGGGGDDDNDDEDNRQPSTNEEDSPHSEEPSSSDPGGDSLPQLIRPESVEVESVSQWKGEKCIVQVVQDVPLPAADVSHGSEGSAHESPGSGGNYSQASTGVVGEGADVAAAGDLSEASTAALEEERKSTSSSSAGHKSEQGSTISSSSYHGDLSSLSTSSGGSLSRISPEVRRHLPLHSMLRTQSTSDTSSSSAASKEDKIHSKIAGYKLISLEEEENSKEDDEVCSSQEDLFSSQGHREERKAPNQSADESHFMSPQHRSTPVDGQSHRGSQEHAHEKSLYKQVLTTKHRTSTPVEGGHGEFLSTPPSQGTPIDNVAFKSLQFSGENVRETSSSSSDKVPPSPETYNSIPAMDPSSPTASEDEKVEEKTSRNEKSSEKGSSERQNQENVNVTHSSDKRLSVVMEESEISRAAAALVESFDMSQSQEKQEKPASLKPKETSDDEEVVLPLWQQKQQEAQALQQTTEDKKSSSNASSSQVSPTDEQLKGESPTSQVQQWQSVISAVSSSSSGSQVNKVGHAAQESKVNNEQPVQVVDVSFLEDAVTVPAISKVEGPKDLTSQGPQLSLSPSSLVIEPFKPDDEKINEDSPVLIPGPTQPDMSEDMFRPVTQEGGEEQIISDKPADEPMEQDEDSQDIAFSLHLTQSQAEMASQAALEPSQPMEVIQEELPVAETADDVKEDKPDETIQKEEVASLTKQDSSSQSILALLVKPLSKVSGAMKDEDQDMNQGQQKIVTSSNLPEHPALSCPPLQSEEERDGKVVDDNVQAKKDPLPSADNVTAVAPPEDVVLAEDSGGGSPPREESAAEERAKEQLNTPEKDTHTSRPVKPRLPSAVFSETSSESGAGGFHFSLPREPLRPLISTTPPPIKPVRQADTPDSEERSSRRNIIPDDVLPVVTETPGMSSQAPPSSLDQRSDQSRPQSLTVSMPRLGSPQSDSESEPIFHLEPVLPPASTTPGTSAALQPSVPKSPRSIFSRAREALAKSKKREVVSDSDPFAFTAEDEAPEPVRKRPRQGSPRGRTGSPRATGSPRGNEAIDDSKVRTREASTSRTAKGPSKEEEVAKPSSSREVVGGKRTRQESGTSSESEASEERSKRARKEENEAKEQEAASSSEAVRYKQITHTRTITTVTTQIQRVVTVSIVGKESGEVVQVLTYEEDGEPNIESKEEEKERIDEFVESSNLDGSRMTLTAKSPKPPEHPQQSRSSPRVRNDKTPVATRSASKSLERTSSKPVVITTPGKSGSDKGAEDSGKGKGDDPQSRDEPAVEIPAVTRQTTMPVVEEEENLKRTSSSDASLTPGTRVLAKWLDSYFYPGVISTKQYKNGRYLVTFDDGDKRRIPRENLIIKDLLPVGQSVMAQGDVEDDFYEEGVIVSHYRDGNKRGYEIQTPTGAISRYLRSRVILSEQQAAAILSSESSFNVTSSSSVSIGPQSLRSPRKEGSGASSRASVSPHNITKSRSTSSKDTSESSSDEKAARGKNAARASPHASPRLSKAASLDITPKSTHKVSSHKGKAQARRAGHRIAESESSSDEQHRATASKKRPVKRGLSSSYSAKSPSKSADKEAFQAPSRRSPRKQMSGREDTSGTPPMPGNRNIFAGLAFLVTGVVRDKNAPEESDDSESERIDFNRDNLKRQIEAGGGVVLTSFTQSQISGAECFLISHTHQRTQKYFQSLASGIPCVSHMWINDSCACDRRLDYKRYLLPAGESLELGEIVECRPRRNILGGMRVYLHGSLQFKDTWSSVLLAAGCKMVTKLPSRVDYQCDVVICEDSKLPASVTHAVNLLGIPIVSLEWLLQSLINGRQVPFDGHPKYDYRYKNA